MGFTASRAGSVFTCVLMVLAPALRAGSQANAAPGPGMVPYGLSIAVDEVDLTFHAADAHGLPVNDLKLEELSLLDNGQPPAKILAFESLQNLPIRAGILLDTSASMEEHHGADRAIAIKYAQRLLRQQSDRAFVMDFGYLAEVPQSWTSNPAALTAGIRSVTTVGQRGMGGTAIFTAIYQACLNQFGRIDHAASGNFILLFSDGEDNASHAYLEQAVDICQHTNTAIYAFRAESKYGLSSGPKTLAELAAKTGGRVFYDDDSEAIIDNDLRTIEADLRNQYRLLYKPAELKRDGSYHRIELKGPERVDSTIIRSGYYAPGRRPPK
jgi:Ca-activated chloride channel family protein